MKRYAIFLLAVGCVSFSAFAADECHSVLEQQVIRFSREGHADHVEEFPYNVTLWQVQQVAAKNFGISEHELELSFPISGGSMPIRSVWGFSVFQKVNKGSPQSIYVSCKCKDEHR